MTQNIGHAVYIVRAAAALDLDEVRCFCVALAENEEGAGFALTFTVPLDGFTDQDRQLGQATYSITDGLGRTIYGGIASSSINAEQSHIQLWLTHEASQTLELPGILDLDLEVEQDAFGQVADGLRRVLDINQR